MQHGTRKRPRRAISCAAALGLAIALGAPGGCALALAGPGAGDAGGADALNHVDEPFGQIVRIIPDVGMSALMYLPALPVDPYYRDEETGHPALQVLYVDRAYADAPDEWQRWGTFEWDEDWQEYASGIDSIQPVYDDDYEDPTILYCTVSYSSETIDYRDFYLRATAVTLVDGVPTTVVYEPALIAYDEKWLPDPKPDPDDHDEDGPIVVNPPAVDAGDGGGNRGGVGQGESGRVDPESAPEDLLPSPEKAEAALPSTAPARGGIADGGNASAGDGEDAGADAANSAQRGSAAASNAATPADPAAGEAPGEERIPGFVWAVGATFGALAIAGAAVAIRRAGRRRARS